MKYLRFLSILSSFTIGLIGCTSTNYLVADSLGEGWEITLVNGFHYPVSLSKLGGKLYIECDELRLSGEYSVAASGMSLKTPEDSLMRRVEFRMLDDQRWVITSARSNTSQMSHLVGAKLTRS
ncbi:hypothetical protein ACFSJ3_17195 [Corallincola platygyrae]|uniref:Uncharacterized protein n=1 Tax=Corallincola platygyrae TaxID=1193278 RepID=A0ABW4XV00_9GAMM